MTLKTRSSCESDYDWLFALHRASYFDVITRQFGCWDEDEQLRFFLDVWKSQNITVLIKNAKPVGMFQLNEYVDHLWLAELQVTTEHQNNGIGSEVIQMLLLKARTLDLPLRLRVLYENHRAEKLYRRRGFRQINNTEYHHVMEAT